MLNFHEILHLPSLVFLCVLCALGGFLFSIWLDYFE